MWCVCFIDIVGGILATFYIIIPVDIWLVVLKKNPTSFDNMAKRHKNLFFIVPNVLFDAVFILAVCYMNHPLLSFFTAISIAMQWNWGDLMVDVRNDLMKNPS
jgi:hypothetical protein